MKTKVRTPFEGCDLGFNLSKLSANAFDRPFESHAIGFELGGARCCVVRDRGKIRHALTFVSVPAAMLDMPRELFDARLVVSKIVLETFALLVEIFDRLEIRAARFVR